MLSSLIWAIFSLTLLMIAPTNSSSPSSNENISHYESNNLNSVIPSIILKNGLWFGFGIPVDPGDIYEAPLSWSLFISSNETILSTENCPLFQVFECFNPNCYEYTSLSYSQSYPEFSNSHAVRLNLTNQPISFAYGAWETKTALHLHNCESKPSNYGQAVGQVGLGLSGSAYQNFKTPNPIFSIFINTFKTAELIFGFNETYVDDVGSAISIPCDLDWKMHVERISIGNTILSDNPIAVIFDVQTLQIALPEPYYTSFRNYFFALEILIKCFDQTTNKETSTFFFCIVPNDKQINDLPALVFTLENGTQFYLLSASYMDQRALMPIIQFALFTPIDPTLNYIRLGRIALGPYYTVFEKLSNETPTITLYPLTRRVFIPDEKLLEISDSYEPSRVSETSTSNSFSASTFKYPDLPSAEIQTNSENESNAIISKIESKSYDVASSGNVSYSSEDNIDYEPEYFIIIVLVVLTSFMLICIIVVLIGFRQGWLRRKKTVEGQNSTIELNENSIFVTSHISSCNVYDDGNEASD